MTPRKIGRYEVKSELGRGGMATVFLAADPLIGRDVAVKVLPREFLHDPNFRGRFEREARTIAMLEHPAIVPIYDFGEQDGQPYLVMRYMKGGTLGDLIKQGPIPVDEAADILKRLGAALDHAHSRGVIHRDLKPGNILFDETGHPFLSDFGIVKLAQATATFTGESIIGTPAYMSPEQVHGDKEIDGRSDIYTLGVILFEMLTGQMPYRAETPAKLMMAHVLNPVPRIHDVRPDLPQGADDIIGKALAKSPDERFSTASDLTVALEDTLHGRPAASAQATVLDVQGYTGTGRTTGLAGSEPGALRQQVTGAAAGQPTGHAPGTRRPDSQVISSTGGSRRTVFGVGAIVAILALCCGGFLIYSFVIGDGLPFGSATATPTEGAVISNGTPDGETTPDGLATPDLAATDSAATAIAANFTPTTDPQESQIATRIAESTFTAETRAAQTAAAATAVIPTLQVERAIQLVLDAQNNTPLFGPEDGSLVHVSDGFVKAYYSGLSVRDYVVDAVFYNPYAASRGSWDIGYTLREGDFNEQLRLVVEFSGDWSLTDRRGDNSNVIATGMVSNLNTGENDGNRLTVFLQGDVGHFFVNGQYVSELDLSSRNSAGDIGVATTMFAGYEIEGESTEFEDFTVWPLQ